MLLFLAILAEGHSEVRTREDMRRKDPAYDEYGIVSTASQAVQKAMAAYPPR